MNDTAPAPLLDNLRQATAQSHQDLESLPVSASIMDPHVTKQQYSAYLALMRDVVADTEENIFPLIENIIHDLKQRTKTDLIGADLKALGAIVPDTHLKPLTRNLKEISEGFALGIMYVVEGSSLGGRVILKNITTALGFDAENGAGYFAGYGGQTGSTWRLFLAALAEHETQNNSGDEIIAGANFAFDAINAHFRNNAPV
ncbi:biliverdin-producing heme oxygenase [uncultured Flavobacterium sp.]|uniref:biliverdin-producing heme oxygenase n=1 Tax=uncultured Flavobacterium sp. TaxID=165435 RepID=UPI0025D0B7B0|nr:biliverdin-producing heme oxygenase [uncultured Flavobacterium sp.]